MRLLKHRIFYIGPIARPLDERNVRDRLDSCRWADGWMGGGLASFTYIYITELLLTIVRTVVCRLSTLSTLGSCYFFNS